MNSKICFEKVFSEKRMERYFNLHSDEEKAILHYQCNLELAESFYVSLSVFEVVLRNALCRELENATGRKDWYSIFPTVPGLTNLNKYITTANKQISGRNEIATPDKIVAELTLGFWVSLLNSEYERVLWKNLRKAFPNIPKQMRQRKNISAPLNTIRAFRNRIFHNESICWNIHRVGQIHDTVVMVIGWMDKDVPAWISQFDRFDVVKDDIKTKLNWK